MPHDTVWRWGSSAVQTDSNSVSVCVCVSKAALMLPRSIKKELVALLVPWWASCLKEWLTDTH